MLLTCSSCHQPWWGFSHGRGRSCTRSTRTVLSSWWISTLKSKQFFHNRFLFRFFHFTNFSQKNGSKITKTFHFWSLIWWYIFSFQFIGIADIIRVKQLGTNFIFSDCSVGAWLLLFFCGGCVKFILCVAAVTGEYKVVFWNILFPVKLELVVYLVLQEIVLLSLHASGPVML